MQTSGRCGPGKPWWNFSATSMNADHSEINIILLRAQYPCASFQIPLLSCFTHLHILQNRKLHNLTSLRILQRQVTEQRSAANLCAAQHRPAASELQWNYWNQSMVLKKINKPKRVFLSSIQWHNLTICVAFPRMLGEDALFNASSPRRVLSHLPSTTQRAQQSKLLHYTKNPDKAATRITTNLQAVT